MFVKISNTKYSVSEYGLIRNDKTNKILKIQDNGKGYKKVTLTNNGKPCQYYIHRLVAEYFLEKKSKDKLLFNNNGFDFSIFDVMPMKEERNNESDVDMVSEIRELKKSKIQKLLGL